MGDVAAWEQAGLLYTVADGVAWLRMNRPDRANAMDHYPGGNGPNGMGLRDALLDAIADATEDRDVKVAVITGTGRTFSGGADLRQPGGTLEIPEDAASAGDGGARRRHPLRLVPPVRVHLAERDAVHRGGERPGGRRGLPTRVGLRPDLHVGGGVVLGDLRPYRSPARGRRGMVAHPVAEPAAREADGVVGGTTAREAGGGVAADQRVCPRRRARGHRRRGRGQARAPRPARCRAGEWRPGGAMSAPGSVTSRHRSTPRGNRRCGRRSAKRSRS